MNIKELAEEAGLSFGVQPIDTLTIYFRSLERFAKLVAAAEREACAKLCENVVSDTGFVQASWCVQAIRQRGNDEHQRIS